MEPGYISDNVVDDELPHGDYGSEDDVHSTVCTRLQYDVHEREHIDMASSPAVTAIKATHSSSDNDSSSPNVDGNPEGDRPIVSPTSEIDSGSSSSTPTPQKSTTRQVHRFNLDLDAAISDIYSNSTTTTSTMSLGDVVTAARNSIIRHRPADGGPSVKTFKNIWENVCDAADDHGVTVSEAAAFVSLLQLTETVNRSAKGCISIANDPSQNNELVIHYVTHE